MDADYFYIIVDERLTRLRDIDDGAPGGRSGTSYTGSFHSPGSASQWLVRSIWRLFSVLVAGLDLDAFAQRDCRALSANTENADDLTGPRDCRSRLAQCGAARSPA